MSPVIVGISARAAVRAPVSEQGAEAEQVLPVPLGAAMRTAWGAAAAGATATSGVTISAATATTATRWDLRIMGSSFLIEQANDMILYPIVIPSPARLGQS